MVPGGGGLGVHPGVGGWTFGGPRPVPGPPVDGGERDAGQRRGASRLVAAVGGRGGDPAVRGPPVSVTDRPMVAVGCWADRGVACGSPPTASPHPPPANVFSMVAAALGVAVDAQGGSGMAVAESVLGLQDLALAGEGGGHGVPQPVQGDVGVPRPVAGGGEPVAQGRGRQPGGVRGSPGEHPWATPSTGGGRVPATGWSDRSRGRRWPDRE